MRFIPTKVHGVMDYLVGMLMIAIPWILGYADGGAATWIFVVLGAGAILYSLVTDYECGVSKNLPMKTHLSLDLLSGVLLAFSPWIFGFAEQVYMPHLVSGIFEIMVSLMTRRVPGNRRIHHKQNVTV